MLIDKERQEGLLVHFVSDSSLCQSESDVPIYLSSNSGIGKNKWLCRCSLYLLEYVEMWVRFVNFVPDECAQSIGVLLWFDMITLLSSRQCCLV